MPLGRVISLVHNVRLGVSARKWTTWKLTKFWIKTCIPTWIDYSCGLIRRAMKSRRPISTPRLFCRLSIHLDNSSRSSNSEIANLEKRMAMKLHIEHTTIFSYEEPISEAYTEMRLRPLEGAGQRCLRFKLVTQPSGEVMQYTDRYGNLVHHFDTLQSHDRVVVKAASEVYLTDASADDQRDLSPLDQFDYLAPAKYTPIDERIRRFAEPHIVTENQ